MRLLSGKMSAVYSGRVAAELSVGDVVLLIRTAPGGDGSVVVMSAASGVLPRNWMPAGSDCQETAGGYVFTKGEERLEVYIHELYLQQEVPDAVDTHLEKVGSEVQFADLLAKELALISSRLKTADLTLTAREFRTSAGPIDILASNEESSFVIEVKRRKCTVADVYQLHRYIEHLKRDGHKAKIVGVLIGPSATRQLLAAEEADISYLRLSFEQARRECGLLE